MYYPQPKGWMSNDKYRNKSEYIDSIKQQFIDFHFMISQSAIFRTVNRTIIINVTRK